jgi:hypothetical protein
VAGEFPGVSFTVNAGNTLPEPASARHAAAGRPMPAD